MAAEFCLRNISIHARKVLLHAVNLRHGTDGFTSPPKEVVLRIFITLKNPLTSAGIHRGRHRQYMEMVKFIPQQLFRQGKTVLCILQETVWNPEPVSW